MRAPALALAALALLLAGCTQAPPPANAPAAGAKALLPFYYPAPPGNPVLPGGSFMVPQGLARIVVAAAWTCPEGACEMDLTVHNVTGAPAASASGSRGATLEVAQPAPGTWGATMLARSAGMQAEGSIQVRWG